MSSPRMYKEKKHYAGNHISNHFRTIKHEKHFRPRRDNPKWNPPNHEFGRLKTHKFKICSDTLKKKKLEPQNNSSLPKIDGVPQNFSNICKKKLVTSHGRFLNKTIRKEVCNCLTILKIFLRVKDCWDFILYSSFLTKKSSLCHNSQKENSKLTFALETKKKL